MPMSRQKETKQMTTQNLCAKTRPATNPYETWISFDGSCRWDVLKKWQANDDKPYARWFCKVYTPFMPDGELGDVYVSGIKAYARKQEQE
jgi:hypothetical protein